MNSVDPTSPYFCRVVRTPAIPLPDDRYGDWGDVSVVYYRGRLKSLRLNRAALVGDMLEERDAHLHRIRQLLADPKPEQEQELSDAIDAGRACWKRICLKQAEHVIDYIEIDGKRYPPTAETFAMLDDASDEPEDFPILQLLVDAEWIREVLRISGLPFLATPLRTRGASATNSTASGPTTFASRPSGTQAATVATPGRPG